MAYTILETFTGPAAKNSPRMAHVRCTCGNTATLTLGGVKKNQHGCRQCWVAARRAYHSMRRAAQRDAAAHTLTRSTGLDAGLASHSITWQAVVPSTIYTLEDFLVGYNPSNQLTGQVYAAPSKHTRMWL